MRSTTRGVVRPIRRESAKCIPSPWAALIVVSFVAGCATLRPLPLTASTSPPAAASANELPFDPSPEDRPSAGITGFVDTVKVALADGTEAIGPRIQGVQPGSGLDAAGVKKDDVIVGVGGTILRPGDPDPTARCRDLILTHPPDTTTRFLSGMRAVAFER